MLDRLEELLQATAGAAAPYEDEPAAPLPPPLDGGAVVAVHRLQTALPRRPSAGRWLAPDGRYEHAALLFVDVADPLARWTYGPSALLGQ